RGTVPAVGQRPAVGAAAPQLPPTVRALAAAVRSVGRTLRIETQAPKGSLVHIYRNGELVRSVTPEEAKTLSIPSNGASAEDVQIVVVTRTGEVLATPPAETPTGTGESSGDKSSTTATTQPASRANAGKAAATKANAGKAAATKANAGKAAATKAAATKAAANSTGKSTTTSGQRQTSDKNK
ncbi:MAG: hypothetical protein RLZZ88_795, partial [Actinomycetota bacterium]